VAELQQHAPVRVPVLIHHRSTLWVLWPLPAAPCAPEHHHKVRSAGLHARPDAPA